MASPREPALCQLYRHTFVPRIQKIQRSSVYTTCMLKGRSYCARMRAAHIRAYSKRPFTEHTHHNETSDILSARGLQSR